jgi:hypothetical protein
MSSVRWNCALAALAILAPSVLAQHGGKYSPPSGDSKEAKHEQMSQLAEQIAEAKARGAGYRELQALQAEYQALSRSLGGDEPVKTADLQGLSGAPAGGYLAVPPPCSGTPFTLRFNGTSGPITPSCAVGIRPPSPPRWRGRARTCGTSTSTRRSCTQAAPISTSR